jgi:calcineurin-like phosphoesterase family protein
MGKQEPQHHFADASKLYFTSDDHFFHKHILEFCERPFANAEEMNEALIENWNNKVPEDGIVFHLGDFAWGPFEKWMEVRKRLNGTIYLILGNHDRRNVKSARQFDELFDYHTYQMRLEVEHRKVYINHFPFLCYDGTYRSKEDYIFQLHGHTHQRIGDKGKDAKRLLYRFPTQYDVGVDNNNYAPVSWYEVDTIIKKQIADAEDNDTNIIRP